LLRGALEAFRAIASVARWEGRRERRLARGPWRPGWPLLAANLGAYGFDTALDSWAGRAEDRSRQPATALAEAESLALLRAARLRVVDAVPVRDPSAAVTAAARFGGPVALKLDAAGIAHKSEFGGVVLDLVDAEAVHAAATRLLELGNLRGLTVRGLLVEPMAPAGLELILGLRRDAQFGPVVLAGIGGTLAEVLDDVAIRLAPLDLEAADAMLDELRGARLLGGVRGRPPVDRQAVGAMIVALGRLGIDRPDIVEVDLNPVVASPSGAVAVDALVVVEGPGSG
jgi:acetate---CoA ligase (ADP-forming)